jgi:DNA ligase-1
LELIVPLERMPKKPKPFRPMRAEKLTDLSTLRFPVYCTPKIDGVRCLIMEGRGAVSRALKPIPNRHARALLADLPPGLDGELALVGARNFGEASSAIMARDGEPELVYLVFDYFLVPSAPYLERASAAAAIVNDHRERGATWLQMLSPDRADSAEALARLERAYLAQGFEGLMLRSGDGPYKHGKSTEREGYLLKLKRFEDAEAVVVGYEELEVNENEQTRDALGLAERSSHKAGKRPGGVLGALVVRRPDGVAFKIGTGYTAAQRADLFALGERVLGRWVKYSYQPSGGKDKPRFPSFLGFRHPDDLDVR